MTQMSPQLSYLSFQEKLEVHAHRVRHLKEHGFSFPAHMTLGLVTYCDQFCKGCYAGGYRFNPKIVFTASLDTLKSALGQAAAFGQEYEEQGHPVYSRATLGLKAVTLVGSGEPLLYPHLKDLLRFLKQDLNLDIGLYTNGNNLRDGVQRDGDSGPQDIATWVLESCRFVRISLDAASAETHEKERGVPDQFDRILDNIRSLVARRAASGRAEPTVGLQFTIDDNNVHEILQAAHMAKDLGADYLAYKPKYVPWHMRKDRWTAMQLDDIKEQLDAAQALADSGFQVHGKAQQFATAWGPDRMNAGSHYPVCTGVWMSGYMDVDVRSPDRHAADMRCYLCVNKNKEEKDPDGNFLWSAGPVRAETDFRAFWEREMAEVVSRIDLNHCIAGCRNDPFNRLLKPILEQSPDGISDMARDPATLPSGCHVNHI